jgi:hypothetical protein
MFHKSTSNLIATPDDDSDDNKNTYGIENPVLATTIDRIDTNILSISSSSGHQPVQNNKQTVVVEIEKADIHQEKMFVRSKIPVAQPQARRRKLSSADRDISMDKGSKNDENEIIQLNSSVSVENGKGSLFESSRANTVVGREEKETAFMYEGEKKKSESSSLGSPEKVEVVDEKPSKTRSKRKLKSKERVRSSVEDLTSVNEADGGSSTSTSLSDTETSQRKQSERVERRAKPVKRAKDLNKQTKKKHRHLATPTDYSYSTRQKDKRINYFPIFFLCCIFPILF